MRFRDTRGRLMQWRVLGPVTAAVDGAELRVARPQQRAVLAYLLLNPDRVVPTERLVAALWDEAAPRTARAQVQTCVSALRRACRALGLGAALVTQPAGYRLRVDPGELDVVAFGERLAQARQQASRGRLAAS